MTCRRPMTGQSTPLYPLARSYTYLLTCQSQSSPESGMQNLPWLWQAPPSFPETISLKRWSTQWRKSRAVTTCQKENGAKEASRANAQQWQVGAQEIQAPSAYAKPPWGWKCFCSHRLFMGQRSDNERILNSKRRVLASSCLIGIGCHVAKCCIFSWGFPSFISNNPCATNAGMICKHCTAWFLFKTEQWQANPPCKKWMITVFNMGFNQGFIQWAPLSSLLTCQRLPQEPIWSMLYWFEHQTW